jgi:hypothetical protein
LANYKAKKKESSEFAHNLLRNVSDTMYQRWLDRKTLFSCILGKHAYFYNLILENSGRKQFVMAFQ